MTTMQTLARKRRAAEDWWWYGVIILLLSAVTSFIDALETLSSTMSYCGGFIIIFTAIKLVLIRLEILEQRRINRIQSCKTQPSK